MSEKEVGDKVKATLDKKVQKMRSQVMSFSNDGVEVSLNVPDTADVKETFGSMIDTVAEQQGEIFKVNNNLDNVAQENRVARKKLVDVTSDRLQQLLKQNLDLQKKLCNAQKQLRNFSYNIQGFEDPQIDEDPIPETNEAVLSKIKISIEEDEKVSLFPTEDGAMPSDGLSMQSSDRRKKKKLSNYVNVNGSIMEYKSIPPFKMPLSTKGKWQWAFKKVLQMIRRKKYKISVMRSKLEKSETIAGKLETVDTKIFDLSCLMDKRFNKLHNETLKDITNEIANTNQVIERNKSEQAIENEQVKENLASIGNDITAINNDITDLRNQQSSNLQTLLEDMDKVKTQFSYLNILAYKQLTAQVQELSNYSSKLTSDSKKTLFDIKSVIQIKDESNIYSDHSRQYVLESLKNGNNDFNLAEMVDVLLNNEKNLSGLREKVYKLQGGSEITNNMVNRFTTNIKTIEEQGRQVPLASNPSETIEVTPLLTTSQISILNEQGSDLISTGNETTSALNEAKELLAIHDIFLKELLSQASVAHENTVNNLKASHESSLSMQKTLDQLSESLEKTAQENVALKDIIEQLREDQNDLRSQFQDFLARDNDKSTVMTLQEEMQSLRSAVSDLQENSSKMMQMQLSLANDLASGSFAQSDTRSDNRSQIEDDYPDNDDPRNDYYDDSEKEVLESSPRNVKSSPRNVSEAKPVIAKMNFEDVDEDGAGEEIRESANPQTPPEDEPLEVDVQVPPPIVEAKKAKSKQFVASLDEDDDQKETSKNEQIQESSGSRPRSRSKKSKTLDIDEADGEAKLTRAASKFNTDPADSDIPANRHHHHHHHHHHKRSSKETEEKEPPQPKTKAGVSSDQVEAIVMKILKLQLPKMLKDKMKSMEKSMSSANLEDDQNPDGATSNPSKFKESIAKAIQQANDDTFSGNVANDNPNQQKKRPGNLMGSFVDYEIKKSMLFPSGSGNNSGVNTGRPRSPGNFDSLPDMSKVEGNAGSVINNPFDASPLIGDISALREETSKLTKFINLLNRDKVNHEQMKEICSELIREQKKKDIKAESGRMNAVDELHRNITDLNKELISMKANQNQLVDKLKEELDESIGKVLTGLVNDISESHKESVLSTKGLCLGCGRASNIRMQSNSRATSPSFLPSLNSNITPGPDIYRSGFRTPGHSLGSPPGIGQPHSSIVFSSSLSSAGNGHLSSTSTAEVPLVMRSRVMTAPEAAQREQQPYLEFSKDLKTLNPIVTPVAIPNAGPRSSDNHSAFSPNTKDGSMGVHYEDDTTGLGDQVHLTMPSISLHGLGTSNSEFDGADESTHAGSAANMSDQASSQLLPTNVVRAVPNKFESTQRPMYRKGFPGKKSSKAETTFAPDRFDLTASSLTLRVGSASVATRPSHSSQASNKLMSHSVSSLPTVKQ